MIQDRPASLPFLPSPLPLFLGPHQLKLETTPLRSKQNKKKKIMQKTNWERQS